MAFNVNNFIRSSSKSIQGRIFDTVISAAVSRLPMGLLSSATSTAQSLFNVGASFESVSAFATQRTDSIVNQSSQMYFALAGRDPARVASADLKALRRTNSENLNTHLREVNPTTKIASKKKDASAIMDGVI